MYATKCDCTYATYFGFIKSIYLEPIKELTPENSDDTELPPKSRVIICPNPKCNTEIEEPILLNNLSRTPAEQYYACPHCLIKLDAGTENEEEVIEENLDVVPVKPQKGEVEAPVKLPKMEEKGPTKCPHYFGYLTKRPKDASIPQECLTCPKIVECMLKL